MKLVNHNQQVLPCSAVSDLWLVQRICLRHIITYIGSSQPNEIPWYSTLAVGMLCIANCFQSRNLGLAFHCNQNYHSTRNTAVLVQVNNLRAPLEHGQPPFTAIAPVHSPYIIDQLTLTLRLSFLLTTPRPSLADHNLHRFAL